MFYSPSIGFYSHILGYSQGTCTRDLLILQLEAFYPLPRQNPHPYEIQKGLNENKRKKIFYKIKILGFIFFITSLHFHDYNILTPSLLDQSYSLFKSYQRSKIISKLSLNLVVNRISTLIP